MPAKGDNRGTKRRKINKNKYITIQETWGPPTRTKPNKNCPENKEQPQNPNKSKKMRTREVNENIELTNIVVLKNKIIVGPVIKEQLEWEEPRYWDKALSEHRKIIEQEEQDRNMRLEKQRRKKESWELYNTCKEYLENNNKFWRTRKDTRMEENKRTERLHEARIRTKIARQKRQNDLWEGRLQEGLRILPIAEQEKEKKRTAKKELKELKIAKDNLWKLRGKERKLVETEQVTRIRKLDEKTDRTVTLLEQERLNLVKRAKNLRTSIHNKENKKKKQELIADTWATYRWITDYLTRTTQEWEIMKQQTELEEQTRITTWDNKTRQEKIKCLQEQEELQKAQEKEHKKTVANEIIEFVINEITKQQEIKPYRKQQEILSNNLVNKNDKNLNAQQNKIK